MYTYLKDGQPRYATEMGVGIGPDGEPCELVFVDGVTVPVTPELISLVMLQETAPAPPPLEGFRATGLRLVVTDGAITQEHVVEPIVFDRPARVAELCAEIDGLRDAKIEGGFDFELAGVVHRIQSRASDRENIVTLGMLARSAVQAGAEVGDLRWLYLDRDFGFITEANVQIGLDAHDMARLFLIGMGFKDALTFSARQMKDWVVDLDRTDAELAQHDPAIGWPA
ncbi:MAG: hypothetical protein C0481_02805 [Phenylobacterium sp.]|uniref:DUF4376 domain-containing protein n=1 Tax=Phenylobacterium sp. TaxID=1871053 RepID=UPI0025E2A933|nr:hypothetical protein [Phenylobacterium sp.]MBA4010774.1 hypothetical protein [Phenylobacterium sp.]